MKRIWIRGLLLVMLIVVLWPLAGGVFASENESAEPDETPQKLTISVVQEIPAEDFEDNAVPLAAFPGTKQQTGMGHLVLMSGALVLVLAYIAYSVYADRKLFRLRKEAALVEQQAMRKRRRDRHDL